MQLIKFLRMYLLLSHADYERLEMVSPTNEYVIKDPTYLSEVAMMEDEGLPVIGAGENSRKETLVEEVIQHIEGVDLMIGDEEDEFEDAMEEVVAEGLSQLGFSADGTTQVRNMSC